MHLVDVQQHRNRKPISHRETLRSQISTQPSPAAGTKNITWSARGRVASTRRNDSERAEEPRQVKDANRGTHPRRLQVLPSQNSNNRMGSLFQCHHGSQRFRKVQHPRCHLLRPRSHEHVIRARSSSPLHHTPSLIVSSYFRCVPRINRISYINVDKLASPRHLSPSSLTTRTGKTALQEWRAALR